MVKLLYTLSVLILASAGALFAVSVAQWSQTHPQLDEIRGYSTAVERFKAGLNGDRDPSEEKVAPLIVQAKAFTSHINPAPPAQNERSPAPQVPARNRPTPAVRPKASSVAFKLHGTSVYRDRPERSMALISEPGGSEGERKWVREGAALGHFVVQEIRRGMVVLSDGDIVREMTVEPGPGRRSLVRSYTASVARANASGAPERVEADSNAVAEPATR